MSIEALKKALERIADPRNTHFAGDAQIVAREALAIAEAEKQDKFCDNNCVWTDHHPDCVRASVSWKDMAFARLGVVRDKMQQDDVATVQRFLDGDYTHPQPNSEFIGVLETLLRALENEQDRNRLEDVCVDATDAAVLLGRQYLGLVNKKDGGCMTQQNEIIEMARQACPYTSEELRGAFYDGFVSASKLVAAKEREACCGGDVLNAANINGNDEPHQVVDKYRAAIRARGTP